MKGIVNKQAASHCKPGMSYESSAKSSEMEQNTHLLQAFGLLLLLVAALGSSDFVPLSPPFPPLVLLRCGLKARNINC